VPSVGFGTMPKGKMARALRGIPSERKSGFGRDSCHEQAIKVDIARGVTRFKIVLAGLRHPSPALVADLRYNHDDDIEACTKPGPRAQGRAVSLPVQRTERITSRAVRWVCRDPVTGEVQKGPAPDREVLFQ
jgi:hypothetical protein